MTRLSQTAWEGVHGALDQVTVHYKVLLAPSDRFMYRGKTRRALTCEGPAIYMYARGYKDAPAWVTFDLPDGWEVWSGLAPQADGRHFAKDYDTLADCPLKLGVVQHWSFEAHGAKFDVVVDSGRDAKFDHAAWLANIRKIVDASVGIFGGDLPVDRYVFLFTAGPGAGGGLEHLNSTCIGVGRLSPTAGLGTIAHEFFHLWNIKRIRPVELGPFSYGERVRTRGLWLGEGFTSYYTQVILARAGLMEPSRFWRSAVGSIRGFENSPGRHWISSDEASMEVWNNAPPDRTISYYTSGQVLGLQLDIEIRAATNNAKSLDDFMTALWALCKTKGRGYLPHEPALVASMVAGRDLRPWFDRHVSGTVVPDYAATFAKAGMLYQADRTTTKVLRGLRFSRDGLLFADHEVLGKVDSYGNIDPIRCAGRVKTIADQAVADQDDLDALLSTVETGDRLRVVYETLEGRERASMAAVEDRIRVRPRLSDDPDAGELASAIRAAIPGGH